MTTRPLLPPTRASRMSSHFTTAQVSKCRTLPEEQDWFQCLQLSRPPVLAATLSQLRQLVSQTCPRTASIRASVPRPTCLSLVWLTLPLLPTQLPPTLMGTRLPSRWRLTGSRWVPKAAGEVSAWSTTPRSTSKTTPTALSAWPPCRPPGPACRATWALSSSRMYQQPHGSPPQLPQASLRPVRPLPTLSTVL